MTEQTFETWEEVILDFFEKKKEASELVYLADEIKSINNEYAKEDYYQSDELKDFFDTKKFKKTKEQTVIEFQRIKALKILKLRDIPASIQKKCLIKDYRDKLKAIKEKFEINQWIESSSKNASSVRYATHIIKLTHSLIDSSSICEKIFDIDDGIVTSSSLRNKILDGAVAGNQYAPIFQFLELTLNGIKLAETFTQPNNQVLKSFSLDSEQLNKWNKNFAQSMIMTNLSSHFLAKQVYFPVQENQYHLICNIKSSSLAQAIFEYVKINQQSIDLVKLKNNAKYSTSILSQLIGQAKIKVTGSNHGNASQLNGKRGGQLKLFSTQPPTWKSQLKPPIFKQSLFDNLSTSNIKQDFDYLIEFIMRFKNLDLSIKDSGRREHLNRWLNSIINQVFFYINSIQKLPSSWSNDKDIRLKCEHQYLLDPYRQDERFQAKRKTENWQKVVSQDFARWINHQLKRRDKKFTPQNMHTKMWIKQFEKPLRLDTEDIEIVLNRGKKETVS